MVNVDTRILEPEFGLNESQMWLLLQIAKRLGKKLFCFPSNETLMVDTGWGADKLRQVKQSLVEMGVLRIVPKVGQSNHYILNTEYLGVYVPAKQASTPSEKPTGLNDQPPRKNQPPTPSEKPTPKYYSEEVLDSDTNVSGATNTFSSEGYKNSKEKEKKLRQKKKEADPCYQDMVAAWCEAYPLLGFNGASGKCINEIIAKTRQVMTGRGKEATCEALVNSFKYVIAYVKREHHFCDGKPLTTWNSQYLSIVHEIANGKQKSKPLTTRERINNL